LFYFCSNQAKTLGFKSLFCLTTRTEHWFLERGFTQQSVEILPDEKQKLYNFQRKSKVFSKAL
jgi:amino-acid N-acetyltransferase